MLPFVPLHGWSLATLQMAAGPDADLLFPDGAAELVEAYCDLGDRWMEADVAAFDFSGQRLPDRVRTVIAVRFRRNAPYKEAVRRALAVLSLPGRGMQAARCTARTVDAIWHAAGDTSADFSWYTKRAILAAVYGATLLFWLRDDSVDDAATLAFLDRRLAALGRFGRARKRMTGMFGRAAAP